MTEAEIAVEICMEEARKAFERSTKFGRFEVGAQIHGDRGCMAFQCASKIALQFELPEPTFDASAIEARSDATGTGAAEGESATRQGDAQ